jgi:hypothetical protein
MLAAATQGRGILTGQLLVPRTLPNFRVSSLGCQTIRVHEMLSQKPTFVFNLGKIIIYVKDHLL